MKTESKLFFAEFVSFEKKCFLGILVCDPDPNMASSGPCNVCQKSSTTRCGRCKSVYYCGPEHQKGDWKQHSKVCKAPAATSSGVPGWNPPKAIVAEKGASTSLLSPRLKRPFFACKFGANFV